MMDYICNFLLLQIIIVAIIIMIVVPGSISWSIHSFNPPLWFVFMQKEEEVSSMRIFCATLKHSCLFVYQLGRGARGEIHPKRISGAIWTWRNTRWWFGQNRAVKMRLMMIRSIAIRKEDFNEHMLYKFIQNSFTR